MHSGFDDCELFYSPSCYFFFLLSSVVLFYVHLVYTVAYFCLSRKLISLNSLTPLPKLPLVQKFENVIDYLKKKIPSPCVVLSI